MTSATLFLVGALLCVIALSDARSYCSSTSNRGRKIQRHADRHVGATTWSWAADRKYCSKCNKCNMFVAEMIENAGGKVPQRRWWKWSPIGAREWAKPRSSYLTSASCWTLVTGCYKAGDVGAFGGHVGIVTGKKKITSAARSKVLKNDWGFRAGQSPTFWRYTC